MTRLRILLATTALLACVSSLALAADSNWNQFRGPTGDGHAPAGSQVATTWGETKNVKWKMPIEGKAHSSPVIWNDQVWVTTSPLDGKQAYAICLDLKSGKVIHNLLVFEVPMPQPLGVDKNSYASPTPVIEEG